MADERQDDEQDAADPAAGGLGVHDEPKRDGAPGQSSASDWDMSKSKPSGRSGSSGQDQPDIDAGKKEKDS